MGDAGHEGSGGEDPALDVGGYLGLPDGLAGAVEDGEEDHEGEEGEAEDEVEGEEDREEADEAGAREILFTGGFAYVSLRGRCGVMVAYRIVDPLAGVRFPVAALPVMVGFLR